VAEKSLRAETGSWFVKGPGGKTVIDPERSRRLAEFHQFLVGLRHELMAAVRDGREFYLFEGPGVGGARDYAVVIAGPGNGGDHGGRAGAGGGDGPGGGRGP